VRARERPGGLSITPQERCNEGKKVASRDAAPAVSRWNRGALCRPHVVLPAQLEEKVLYTRKKKIGNLTPRTIPMTAKLYEILSRRDEKRDKRKPWVFQHTYWSSKTGERVQGSYQDRKTLMKKLCKKAAVTYFRFHALRRFGASVLDSRNVNIGSIQRLLGHENRTTTEIYLHSVGSAEREAMDILDLETNACFAKNRTPRSLEKN